MVFIKTTAISFFETKNHPKKNHTADGMKKENVPPLF